MSNIIIDSNLLIVQTLAALIIGLIITIVMLYFMAPTSYRIFMCKLTNKKTLARKIYPGSRREILKVPKKLTPDDLFVMENPDLKNMLMGKARMIGIDGNMKTELGKSTVDGITIHTYMIGEDMVPVDPIKACAGTNLMVEAKKKPLLSQIKGDKKIADLLTADLDEIDVKAKRYNPLSFSKDLTKDQLIIAKQAATKNIITEVLEVRQAVASQSYPVDYVTACNMVQNPIIPSLVEIIDLKIQKRNEDKKDDKNKIREFAIAGAIVIGAIGVVIYVLHTVLG